MRMLILMTNNFVSVLFLVFWVCSLFSFVFIQQVRNYNQSYFLLFLFAFISFSYFNFQYKVTHAASQKHTPELRMSSRPPLMRTWAFLHLLNTGRNRVTYLYETLKISINQKMPVTVFFPKGFFTVQYR